MCRCSKARVRAQSARGVDISLIEFRTRARSLIQDHLEPMVNSGFDRPDGSHRKALSKQAVRSAGWKLISLAFFGQALPALYRCYPMLQALTPRKT
jgi:hypothetical protein